MEKIMIIEFLEKIMKGYDGLIRNIELISFKEVNITISVMEKDTHNWINVLFSITGLTEFSVKQKNNTSNIILSNGISYKEIDGVKFIDFSPYSDLMENTDDFRMSDVYFGAKEINYKVLPYSE